MIMTFNRGFVFSLLTFGDGVSGTTEILRANQLPGNVDQRISTVGSGVVEIRLEIS